MSGFLIYKAYLIIIYRVILISFNEVFLMIDVKNYISHAYIPAGNITLLIEAYYPSILCKRKSFMSP